MISLKKILFSALLCCFTNIVLAQNISVTDSKSAADLLDILTNYSACLTPSAQTAKGDTNTPIKNSYGSFDYTGTNFPFSKGIVLSTWNAKKSEGPFDLANSNGGLSQWAGDTDLENALGITGTVNATVLEFDFIPLTNLISFRYLFASNEYQKEFPCNYSDGFAFLIKDNSATTPSYSNIALIPGTATAVSSFNIHPAINSSGTIGGTIYNCPAKNSPYFNGFNTASSPINYAGQTIPMTAEATVIPGNTYHIKLVVSDNKFKYYNSAVFIEAGSFSSNINLGTDQLRATNNPVCFGASPITLNAPSGATTYKWTKTNGPVTTTTIGSISTYTVTDEGIYTVEAILTPGCPPAIGKITIEYAPEIKLNNTPLQLCITGTSTFDLTKANAALLVGNTDITTIEYYETNTSGALSDLILIPTAYLGNLNNLVYAKLINKYGCHNESAEITLNIVSSSLATSSLPLPIISDFSGNGNSVELVPPSTGGPFEYSLALVGTNYQSSPLFTNLVEGIYIAYIRDTNTCEYWTDFVPLLDYPRYFTPNGDGYHDTWKITNLVSYYPTAYITIFDRYGKLLKQLNAKESWDGKYIGNDLPSDDYWFHVNLADGRIIKGHFSLKR
jgi:gliding motility-associated-like protein